MSIESFYGIPGFEGLEEASSVEADDPEAPVNMEPLTPEEEALFKSTQGLFFSMEASLDGVLAGKPEEPKTIADPEILRKAFERQAAFLRQFAIA